MRRNIWMMTTCLLGYVGSMTAQSVYPGLNPEKFQVSLAAPMAAECVELQDVRLLPSRFREIWSETRHGWFLLASINCCIVSALRPVCLPGVKGDI